MSMVCTPVLIWTILFHIKTKLIKDKGHNKDEQLCCVFNHSYLVQTTQERYRSFRYGGQANDPHTAFTG